MSHAKTRKSRPQPPTPEEEAETQALRESLLIRLDALARDLEEARIGGPVPPDWDGSVGRA